MSFSIRNFPENFMVLPLQEIINTYRLGRIFTFKTAIQETLYRCKIGLYYVLKGRSISDCLYPSLRSILRICRDLLALISFFFTWTENLLSHWKVTAKTAIFIVSLSWQQQQQQQQQKNNGQGWLSSGEKWMLSKVRTHISFRQTAQTAMEPFIRPA